MIKSIQLKNFKGHIDTHIALEWKRDRITALIGPNGSGKTSVLQALQYTILLASTDCSSLFQGERSPDVLVKRGETSFEITLEGQGANFWGTSLIFKKHREQENPWNPELSWNWGTHKSPKFRRWEHSFNTPDEQTSRELCKDLGHTVYLKMVAENLAAPSYIEQIPPRVEYNGYGLASAVAYLMTSEPDRFQVLQDSAKKIIPSIEKIKVKPKSIQRTEQRHLQVNEQNITYDEKRPFVGHELLLDMKGAKEIPAHAVSEGTLLVLGLLTVLVSPTCPNLVLLDDIEQALHPKAQREFINLLRRLVKENANLQIVLTSHSPYIVDELSASEVWVLNNDKNGNIHARQLSDHPDAEKALQVLTTGEFWSAEGETWVNTNGKSYE